MTLWVNWDTTSGEASRNDCSKVLGRTVNSSSTPGNTPGYVAVDPAGWAGTFAPPSNTDVTVKPSLDTDTGLPDSAGIET